MGRGEEVAVLEVAVRLMVVAGAVSLLGVGTVVAPAVSVVVEGRVLRAVQGGITTTKEEVVVVVVSCRAGVGYTK
jgi:hypothetical protein